MENEIYKTYQHNPPHLFQSNGKYFITGATYLKKPFLTAEVSKMRLLNSIKQGCEKYNWRLEDWVILDNHYHLMLHAPKDAFSLNKLVNGVHKFTAIWLKKKFAEFKNERKIFYNYWDTCITYEKSYFARLNYIYFNPVKHGYVVDPKDYIWGSYYFRVKNEKEQLDILKNEYPCDKLDIKDDYEDYGDYGVQCP